MEFPRRPGKRSEYRNRCEDCWPDYHREQKRRFAKRHPRQYQPIDPIKKAAYNRRNRRVNPDAQRAANRRRQRMLASAKQEPYVAMEIFARDEWMCQICLEPVTVKDGRLRIGPTIDHIVPLSKGGDDTPANVRLAHRSCNSSRGAR